MAVYDDSPLHHDYSCSITGRARKSSYPIAIGAIRLFIKSLIVLFVGAVLRLVVSSTVVAAHAFTSLSLPEILHPLDAKARLSGDKNDCLPVVLLRKRGEDCVS